MHLAADLITNADSRETRRLATTLRIAAGGATAAIATAQCIRTDNEVPLGIQHLASAKQRCPPAIRVRIAGQCVTYHHGIVAARIELAPGAEAELDAFKHCAIVQQKGLWAAPVAKTFLIHADTCAKA